MGISAMPARRMEMMVTNLRTNAAYSSRHSSIFVPPQLEFIIDSRRAHYCKMSSPIHHIYGPRHFDRHHLPIFLQFGVILTVATTTASSSQLIHNRKPNGGFKSNSDKINHPHQT
ncbi:hypothetical protein GmHk_15G044782 [Glycine max]|nr:hypothetical protein GmHk_15G044782 [Glycine max]